MSPTTVPQDEIVTETEIAGTRMRAGNMTTAVIETVITAETATTIEAGMGEIEIGIGTETETEAEAEIVVVVEIRRRAVSTSITSESMWSKGRSIIRVRNL